MVRNAGSVKKKKLKNVKAVPDVRAALESIVGCKWSLHILAEVRNGTHRPGALARSTEGLTAKVLNERLAKMIRFQILEKVSFPEIPPRVEYRFTPFGRRFVHILDEIEKLQSEIGK